MGRPGLVIRMSEAVVEAVLLRMSGDTGLVEVLPSEDRLEEDGVDLSDCSELDFRWSRSTREEQEFSSTSFLFAAGFGGDFEVTTWINTIDINIQYFCPPRTSPHMEAGECL